MTNKFVKLSKFSAISRRNVAASSPYCQNEGLQLDLLPAGSSYIEQRHTTRISYCSIVGEEAEYGG